MKGCVGSMELTWGNIIKATARRMPQMNHELLKHYHSNQLDNIDEELVELFKQTLREIANNMGWDENVFRYISYRELSPEERIASLQCAGKKPYERRFDINRTNKRVLAFKFGYRYETWEMQVDIPYMQDYCIDRFGTHWYPTFAIADRGGIGYMQHNQVLIKVMRARLIFDRSEIMHVPTVEGTVLSECLITAKINQSTKGPKSVPPLILHHLTCLGFRETLKLYGLEGAIDIVRDTENYEVSPNKENSTERPSSKNVKSQKYYHVALVPDATFSTEKCYIRVTRDRLDTRVLRFIVGLCTICNFYPKYNFKRLTGREYYLITTGRWIDDKLTHEPYLAGNAETYLSMNQTLIDPKYRKLHNSIGIKYETLDELVLYMFDHIDQLTSDHELGRIDMFRKRLAGCDSITEELTKAFNRRMFKVVNPKNGEDPREPNLRQLLKPISFVPTFRYVHIFRNSYVFYNDNMLAVIGLRFTATTSNDVNGKAKGSKKQVSPHMLVNHYSHPAVVSILTYPASKPILSGSLNPFVQVDECGNIQPPYYLEDLKQVYASPYVAEELKPETSC